MPANAPPTLPPDVALRQAVAHHQAGRLPEAEQLYRAILQAQPDQPDANHNLGVLAVQAGQPAVGLPHLKRAIEAEPQRGQYWLSYLDALIRNGYRDAARQVLAAGRQQGLQGEAVDALAAVLEGDPAAAQTPGSYETNALAALFNEGRHAEAATMARAMTLRFPRHGFGWKVLGAALQRLGQSEEALQAKRQAVAMSANDADAHSNLGNALQDMGRPREAEACYRRALQINPQAAEPHNNLGNTLRDTGRLEEAAACYRQALLINPQLARVHSNLGNALKDLGRPLEAEACYRRALAIDPQLAETHNNLGNALKDLGQHEAAGASYRRALAINPGHLKAETALLMLQLPIAPATASAAATVCRDFDQALRGFAQRLNSSAARTAASLEAICSHTPFYLAYRDGNHVDTLSRYGDLLSACAGKDAPPAPGPMRKKLKLAVVSHHFHRHSVWDINLRGLLANIDRTRFELMLYHVGHDEDGETAFARSLASVWRDTRSIGGFIDWRATIAADQPDIILYPEVGIDSMTLRLASCRLAPLQAASWGHPITSGLPTLDLFFSGELLEPPDADEHYRERLVRLPGTGCCTTPLEVAAEPLTDLAAELAARRGTRFVIAQSPFKFDPADDALYASIAATVGASTFILLRSAIFPWASDLVFARLGQAFRARGLAPEQHLLMIPWLSRGKFFALLDLCDVYLDCPSFSGYTTAWQAVHRGLPVVTREGKFMRQRLAAGLLRRIGQTESIATAADDYVAIAARLAAECGDPERRAARRQRVKSAAPQMDDDIGVVRAFETNLIEAFAAQRARGAAGGD